ncbi:MAG: hypothetical protein ACK5XN_13865, partial [Bacteroidota bacterium]
LALASASWQEEAEVFGGTAGQPARACAGTAEGAGGGVSEARTDSGLGALDRENQDEQPERDAARMMTAARRIGGGLLLDGLGGVLGGLLQGGGALGVVGAGEEGGDGNGDEEGEVEHGGRGG